MRDCINYPAWWKKCPSTGIMGITGYWRISPVADCWPAQWKQGHVDQFILQNMENNLIWSWLESVLFFFYVMFDFDYKSIQQCGFLLFVFFSVHICIYEYLIISASQSYFLSCVSFFSPPFILPPPAARSDGLTAGIQPATAVPGLCTGWVCTPTPQLLAWIRSSRR